MKYFESIKHTVSSSRAIERGVGDIIKWERRTLQRETILKRYKEEGGNLAAPTLGDIDSEPLTQDETMKIEAMRPEYSDLLRKIYPLMAEQINQFMNPTPISSPQCSPNAREPQSLC